MLTGTYLDELDTRQPAAAVNPHSSLAHTGEDWHEYFKRLKSPQEEVDPYADEKLEVIEWGHEIDALRAPGSPGSTAKRVAAQGWDVRAKRSLCHVPPTRFMSDTEGHQKGDIRFEGYNSELINVFASKRAGLHVLGFEATWERKTKDDAKKPGGLSFVSAITTDPILGKAYRSSSTSPRKQRDWEKLEGIEGPLGFGQWLDIVCPKPKKEEK